MSSKVKCGYADKYLAIVPPKCECEVCTLKWELSRWQERAEQAETLINNLEGMIDYNKEEL